MEKQLILFDLDGTLAHSKCAMTLEMAALIEELLKRYSVAIMSGGAYPQFEKQLLGSLPLPDELLTKLYLFPTSGTSFYKYLDRKWVKIYAEELQPSEKKKILDAFKSCLKEMGFEIPKHPPYGEILEDRQTQITFSALGQSAPINLKKKWDPNHLKRLEMMEILQQDLPEFEIRSGGSTSIDITYKNRDKAYGVQQIEKYLGFAKNQILFIADSIFPGGNDWAVKVAGVESWETTGPEMTMDLIKKLLS